MDFRVVSDDIMAPFLTDIFGLILIYFNDLFKMAWALYTNKSLCQTKKT